MAAGGGGRTAPPGNGPSVRGSGMGGADIGGGGATSTFAVSGLEPKKGGSGPRTISFRAGFGAAAGGCVTLAGAGWREAAPAVVTGMPPFLSVAPGRVRNQSGSFGVSCGCGGTATAAGAGGGDLRPAAEARCLSARAGEDPPIRRTSARFGRGPRLGGAHPFRHCSKSVAEPRRRARPPRGPQGRRAAPRRRRPERPSIAR